MGQEHLNRGYVKDYYRDKVLPKWESIAAWARSGLTNGQIAKNLGIGTTTWDRYLGEYEELAEHVREAREDAEMLVENALFKRATGYDVVEVTRELRDGELKVVKKVKKHIQPDVGAAQYWLEHRAPNKWTRNPTSGLDVNGLNAKIIGLAALISAPVPERKIGDENE